MDMSGPNSPPVMPPGSPGISTTIIVGALVIALAVVSVVLRFYTRIFTRVGLGPDDWLILVSVITTLLVAVLILWGNTVSPAGPWVSEVSDPLYVYTTQDLLYLQLSFSSSVLYFTISGTAKLGILSMYLRLFSSSSRFRARLLLAGLLVLAWWVGCTVAALVECAPLERELKGPATYPVFCYFNFNVFWLASGLCEIVLDILILALPVSFVLRMRLSPQQKVTVSGIFLLGAFVIITGILKTALGYAPGSRTPSYANTEVWAAVHAGMSIVCASLPIFRPLATRVARSSLITKTSGVLSFVSFARSKTESRLSISNGKTEASGVRWGGNGGGGGSDDRTGRGNTVDRPQNRDDGEMEMVQQSKLQRPKAVYIDRGLGAAGQNRYENRQENYSLSFRVKVPEDAESSMTSRFANFLERGESSDTERSLDAEGYRRMDQRHWRTRYPLT
ncbi:hypothetical protein AAE478_009925 [Parahypoxylon ruwenzoriense]